MFAKACLAGALALVLSISDRPKVETLGVQAAASDWFAGYQVPLPPPGLRGAAFASVFFTDQEGIDQTCGGNNQVIACARIGGGAMALPNPCQARFAGEAYAAVACHEKGHTLGWSHEG